MVRTHSGVDETRRVCVYSDSVRSEFQRCFVDIVVTICTSLKKAIHT